MDDRLAVRVYEDNFLNRLREYQDKTSLLEKQSVSTTGTPSGGLLTIGTPANGLTYYGQVLKLTTPGSDTHIVFNDGGVYGADSKFKILKTVPALSIGTWSEAAIPGIISGVPFFSKYDGDSSHDLPTGFEPTYSRIGVGVTSSSEPAIIFDEFDTLSQWRLINSFGQFSIISTREPDNVGFYMDNAGSFFYKQLAADHFYSQPFGADQPYGTDNTTLNVNLNADLLDGFHASAFQTALTFPLASTLGGTGINNTGTITNASNTTFLGGGTLNLGGFTVVIPETGTAALATGVTGGQTIYGGTAANEDLTLHGTMNATRTSSYVIIQPTAGNTGVGTSTPGAKLQVNGDASGITAILRVNATTPGNALEVQNSAGVILSGADSRGILFSSGAADIHSLFVGNAAGRINATGTYNIGIGDSALSAVTSGEFNTAIGGAALLKVTTGGYNFGLGTSAGGNLTTGNYNVAIGQSALVTCVSANYNVAIGRNALTLATAGETVGIGGEIFFSLTTGTGNVGIGHVTGGLLTTGSYNVFLGYNAGYRQTTNSNRLIIDNQLRASGATEVTNAIMYGVMAALPASQALNLNAVTSLIVTGSATNSVQNVGILSHNSSGTPAAGFGVSQLFNLQSSTTTSQNAGLIDVRWITATHASRAAAMRFYAYDTAARLAFEIEASGTAAKLAFYGGTTVARGAALTTQLTTITYTTPGVSDFAIQDFVDVSLGAGWAFANHDEANTVLSTIANLQARVAELEARLGSATGVNLFA